MTRVKIGRIHVDKLKFYEAIDQIVALRKRGEGGMIVTPNVDHVVMADDNDAFFSAYQHASLSLADGKPLLWLAQLLGDPLPAKISGSDLVEPLCARFAQEGLSVFLLGARPGVGQRAADKLRAKFPALKIAGMLAPPLHFEEDPAKDGAVVDAIRAAAPDAVLVALGAPRQELWMDRHRRTLAPAILLGIGGTLDFLAGETQRAPRWISDAGFEWLYRLAQEPRRLAHRYLVRDRAFLPIALRTMRERRRTSSRGVEA
jgi:N-acetylglucosaminyldiphosphoundecaprenol N-acetyl-beta-D-mannosaminyltransferase